MDLCCCPAQTTRGTWCFLSITRAVICDGFRENQRVFLNSSGTNIFHSYTVHCIRGKTPSHCVDGRNPRQRSEIRPERCANFSTEIRNQHAVRAGSTHTTMWSTQCTHSARQKTEETHYLVAGPNRRCRVPPAPGTVTFRANRFKLPENIQKPETFARFLNDIIRSVSGEAIIWRKLRYMQNYKTILLSIQFSAE